MDPEPSIQIFISAHKSCVLPSSKLYVPVQVGAANAATRLEGMVPDDSGDNISILNSSFSELTALYWAWRNTESDYVGACHYRRYFCFDGLNHIDPKNDHMQIESDRLCEASIDEYGIDNEELIRQVACSYDAIVPEEWDVGKTETPQGVKTSVREHMKGYGLIKDSAFDLLERIVNERFPEYATDFHDYLYGRTYLGYSCFIMRRELFDLMCAFEFDVLLEFANVYVDSDRTATQVRLGGFLGEILFSTFIMHIKRCGMSVAHFPLVFFSETDPLLNAVSDCSGDASIHHVVWDADDQFATVIGISAQTLLASIEGSDKWEITFALSSQNEVSSIREIIGDVSENISLKFITKPIFDTKMLEPSGKRVMFRNPTAGSMCMAPWLFEQWNDVLFLQGVVVFNEPLCWDDLVSKTTRDRVSILAAQDVCLSAVLNCGENPKSVLLANGLGIAARSLHDFSICYMNLSMARQEKTQEAIALSALHAIDVFDSVPVGEKTRIDRIVGRLNQALLTNAILESCASIKDLPFDMFYPINQPSTVSDWCFADVASSWKSHRAGSASAVFYTKVVNPLEADSSVDNTVFWKAARGSIAYEQLLAQQVRECLEASGAFELRWKDKLFPVGTKRRALAKRSLAFGRKLRQHH